jgi:hypothetical protein
MHVAPSCDREEDPYWRNFNDYERSINTSNPSPPFHVPAHTPAGATLRLHSPGLFILRRPPGRSGVLQANTVAHGTMTEGPRQRVCDELLIFNGRMEKVTKDRACSTTHRSPAHGRSFNPFSDTFVSKIGGSIPITHPNAGGGCIFRQTPEAMHHHRRAT